MLAVLVVEAVLPVANRDPTRGPGGGGGGVALAVSLSKSEINT